MPITQARMLALITAAEDYQQAFQQVQRFHASTVTALEQGNITLTDAWTQIQILFQSLPLRDPIGTSETLASERTHFKKNRRRNDSAAEWQRRKRERQAPTAKQFKHIPLPDEGITGEEFTFGAPSPALTTHTLPQDMKQKFEEELARFDREQGTDGKG